MADIMSSIAALVTMIITLMIIYLLSEHSKLKTSVVNIHLNCVKTVEAASIEGQNCDLGLIKLIVIILLILIIILLLTKLRKSRIFK